MAQAELVKATAGNPPLTLRPPPPEGRVETAERLDRRIVIALRPQTFLPPGVRLMTARLTIRPNGPRGWRFVGWDRLVKERDAVEVGTVSSETTSSIGGELNLGIGGPVGTPKVTLGRSSQVNEAFLVRDDFLQSAAIDDQGVAWIDQRVGGGRDLATNTQFDATIAVGNGSPLATTALFVLPPLEAGGRAVPAASVRIGSRTLLIPDPNDARPLCGIIEFEGLLRTIVRGDRSYSEADDVVRAEPVRDRAAFQLAPAPVAPTYGLVLDAWRLGFQPAGANGRTPLSLGSLDDALALRDWLRSVGTGVIGNGRLVLVNGPEVRMLDRRGIAGLVARAFNVEQVGKAHAASAAQCPTATTAAVPPPDAED